MKITKDLIGKKIVRTGACIKASGDRSYSRIPSTLNDVGEVSFYITSGNANIDAELKHDVWNDGKWELFHQCKVKPDWKYCPKCGEKLDS